MRYYAGPYLYKMTFIAAMSIFGWIPHCLGCTRIIRDGNLKPDFLVGQVLSKWIYMIIQYDIHIHVQTDINGRLSIAII